MTIDPAPIKFAVVNGKYKTGAPILQELVKVPGVEVRIALAAGKPVHKFYYPLFEAGVKVYGSSDMKEMFEGVDVVLCFTASYAGLEGQKTKVMDLAKEAGVKLFVPCEFSLEFNAAKAVDLIRLRKEAIDRGKEIGLPMLRVVNGLVLENFVTDASQHPFIPAEVSSFNWKLEDKKVHIIGSGKVPASWVSVSYLAKWFVHYITTTSLSTLQTVGTVVLEGETLTQLDVVDMWEKKHGEKLEVTFGDLAEAEEKVVASGVKNYWTEYPLFMQVEVAKGNGKLSLPPTNTSYSGPIPSIADAL